MMVAGASEGAQREAFALPFALVAPPGQQTGQLPGPRHLWPREQVFQPLTALAMRDGASATR